MHPAAAGDRLDDGRSPASRHGGDGVSAGCLAGGNRPGYKPARVPGDRMTTWLIRRLIQALFVVLAMSVIVFIGVHVIGNPVDILISPEADQAERARIIAASGTRSAAVEAVPAVRQRRAARRSRPQLRVQRAGAEADRAAHAGDDGTRGHRGADVDRVRHPAGAVRRAVSGRRGRRARSWPAASWASRCPRSGSG